MMLLQLDRVRLLFCWDFSQALAQDLILSPFTTVTRRPCITSTVRVNNLQSTTQEVLENLRQHFEKTSNVSVGTHRLEQKPDFSSPAISVSFNSESTTEEQFEKGDEIEAFSDDASGESYCSSNTVVGAHHAPIKSICLEHPVLKDVVMVRGHGPCEVYCRAGTDESTLKEVVVSRKCAEAVLRGANVFVPGVLACSLHVERGDEVAVTVALERPDSHGGWFVGVTRGTTLDSQHAKAQLEGSRRNDCFIGKGRMKMSRAALFKENHGVAVEMTERIFDLPPFHDLLKGHIFLQNLPSIVAVRVLDPKPGERILDMCAAPGGKTTAIAILMEDKGEVIALDRSHHKVLDIKRLSEEMMLTCIQAFKMDATKAIKHVDSISKVVEPPSQPACHNEISGLSLLALEIMPTSPHSDLHQNSQADASLLLADCSQVNKGAYVSQATERKHARRIKNMSKRGQIGGNPECVKAFLPESFDKVLLDAPCSALGLRPRLFAGEETLEGLRSHACYQRKLLDQAVKLVRPGGILVYSTCTLNPGENEAVVRYALDTYNFLSLLPQNPKIGGPGLVGGLDVFDGKSYKEWLREEEKDLVQRFCPAGPYDTIGFFIAKFVVASKAGLLDAQTAAEIMPSIVH